MGGRKFRGIALAFTFAAFIVLSLSLWDRETVSFAEAKESCITDKCHSKMGKDKFVHGPVAVGDCKACHKPVDKHKFTPIKNISELCYQCHDKVDTNKVVHKPVKEGSCTTCHSPHQSPYKFQLRSQGVDLCFRCHDKKIATGKFIHGPVAVGGCVICHNPHQGQFPRMLRAAGNDVCFTCHTDKAEAFKGKKFSHQPVKDSCVTCHSPHAGEYKFMFKAEGSRDLCFRCHSDKREHVGSVKVKHGGLETPKHCLACHDPHVTDYAKQLKMQPMDLCMSCHDKKLDTPTGKIMDMKTWLARNSIHHGPIKQKDCSACHNPHGSDNFRILKKYFPPVFYAPFDPKNYELCFSCHEKTLVLDPKTTTLTGFRNGDQNLHFLHVNKPVKGRTCRACHDVHATNNPRHIRDAVPFGAWEIPINFTKTSDGGKCLPGCHGAKVFNRVSPAKN